ncbi:hypothetical protein IP86_03070 [Rhodopseudomonas sp. AAP120]|uniref:hypothetical protein n=1 Tax=Rhodopseudomonas sp. AAP120 TaxID=1523430 RepID=UPI0006B9393F|nr:hypothetical protein [Rhodopseudomonas sp. AAP120]KPG01804.1 hypothetical protein IP86_03070 [Rhodopseudomonas sp. AAP120]
MSWEAWGSGDEFYDDDRQIDRLMDAGWLSPDGAEALINALKQCRTVLGNMALENERFLAKWGFARRWPINHEPLRNDAKNLLLIIDELIVTKPGA